MKASGDTIIVSDVMKSLSVYTLEDGKLECLYRYPNGQWSFDAFELHGYCNFDFNKNIQFLKENGKLLGIQGQYSLKEQVNST